MTKTLIIGLLLLPLVLPAAGLADSEQEHRSQYAGMQSREIKSLSPEDVRQLSEGHGWGLSLVAELNGVPGPKHVLELKDELDLSSEQITDIEEIYERMKSQAIPLGMELVRRERELDASFADGTIDEERLGALLDSIARTRRDLRHAHLSAHLQTPSVLEKKQIGDYLRLRGYDVDDPCATVPPGHDPKMWRMHNGCE